MTDANVVLGHLPPRLLGGAMTLDVEPRTLAVARVAEPLGLGVPQTAEAIVRLVDENMLGALRLVTVQRGMPADTSRSSPSAVRAPCTRTRWRRPSAASR